MKRREMAEITRDTIVEAARRVAMDSHALTKTIKSLVEQVPICAFRNKVRRKRLTVAVASCIDATPFFNISV